MRIVEPNSDSNLQLKERLLVILDKYRDLGEVVHPDGTMSVGKIPGKEKWFLFHFYKGLTSEEIQQMERAIGRSFPESLRKFYQQMNGVGLFPAGQVSIWGLRGASPVAMPNYQPIPFAISHMDEIQRMNNVPGDLIFFGEYFGEFRFFTTSHSNSVAVCKPPDLTPLEQWSDVESMITDVADRLSVYFDEEAQPTDPEVNERPVLFEAKKKSG
jgi:hypothetical protein